MSFHNLESICKIYLKKKNFEFILIFSIDDPLKKNATIGFINNFGQIPKQLFKKPHPAKKMNQRTSVIDPGPITPGLSITTSDRLFFHNLDNLKPSLQPIKGKFKKQKKKKNV